VGDQFAESVVSPLIVQRVDKRLVWGEQIERSYDRNSPILTASINDRQFSKKG
jgi:hypothetical protein